MRPLPTQWISHLKDSKERADFEGYVRNSVSLFERLKEIIDNKIDTARKEGLSSKSYDKPSWPMYQADKVGYERALREILELIDLTKE